MLTGIQELLASLGEHVHQVGTIAEQIQKLAASETEHASVLDGQRGEIAKLEAQKVALTDDVATLEKRQQVAQQALEKLREKLG